MEGEGRGEGRGEREEERERGDVQVLFFKTTTCILVNFTAAYTQLS